MSIAVGWFLGEVAGSCLLALDEEGIGMGSVGTPGLNTRVMSLIAEASRDFDLRFPATCANTDDMC